MTLPTTPGVPRTPSFESSLLVAADVTVGAGAVFVATPPPPPPYTEVVAAWVVEDIVEDFVDDDRVDEDEDRDEDDEDDDDEDDLEDVLFVVEKKLDDDIVPRCC
jgi:hypothetical protein